MQLSIVVPVYNEAEAIPDSFKRLSDVAQKLIQSTLVSSVEIIFVDDGSRDGSGKMLSDLASRTRLPSIETRIVQFSRNFGHSAAVFAGLENSKGEWIAVIDADLQDPPECLIEMAKKLKNENADVVYGQRRLRIGEGPFKRGTAWIFYRLLNGLSGVRIPKDTGDFRLMTREVCDVVLSLSEKEPFLRGLVAWVGFNQVPYPYDRQPRTLGETKYPMRKMVRFAVQAITSFSAMPLRMAFYLGAVGILFSILFSLTALHAWMKGGTLPGWTSLVIGFSFIQSLTLTLIGVVGIYLGRVHLAVQNRPRYILRKTIK